ncbi:ATP-binding protein [Bacillus paramycoides]|uniref:VirB4 family type IV secretion system protein n=1 Tax=Bacillus paramycoides TaxID=2026194 RepID=UPI0015C1BE86|nr:ATP-binding protein [Bacillus paramycoides]NWK72617.1 ATP-binding protein [Bacillus paramycoides]
MVRLSKKEQEKYKAEGYDLNFIARVQPQGGIKFNERYIATGDCYVACLYVYSLAEDISPLWLTQLLNHKKTVSSMDIATANKEEVLKDINRSIGELKDRGESERKSTDRDDAYWELDNLVNFARSISQKGEVVKLVKTRIFFYDSVLEQLEKRIQDIKKEISGNNYKSQVFVFKQKEDWISLFASYDAQREYFNVSVGNPVPSENIGYGVPFHHQALKDPRGIYFGQTSTGGAFILDPFFSTSTRKFFNGFVLGKMGFGKSTLLKQLLEGLVGKDCFIRGFDKAGDYREIVREQGGKYIDLSGADAQEEGVESGMINPLEIFATIINEETGVVLEKKSFAQHLSKVSNMLRFLNKDITDTAILEFRKHLTSFYAKCNLVPGKGRKVIGLPANQYPIMEDFYKYLRNIKLEASATPERIRDFERIVIQIEEMVNPNAYGDMFNGPTTLENFENEQIVFFDIDGISKYDKPVFHCQLFTALTFIWSHALKNGRRMKYLDEVKKVSIEDLRYFMVILDECHNVINSENEFANKYVLEFQREMRKFKAGIFFATQSPQEMLPPEGTQLNSATLKSIFELTQYKIFLNMDSSVLGTLRKAIGATFTESDYEKMPTLEQGEGIVQISGSETYNVMFDPDKEQLERFRGGQ